MGRKHGTASESYAFILLAIPLKIVIFGNNIAYPSNPTSSVIEPILNCLNTTSRITTNEKSANRYKIPKKTALRISNIVTSFPSQ